MLRKALQDCAADHDPGPEHDRPPAPKTMGNPRGEGDCEDGAQLVGCTDDAKEVGLDSKLAGIIRPTLAEIFVNVSMYRGKGENR